MRLAGISETTLTALVLLSCSCLPLVGCQGVTCHSCGTNDTCPVGRPYSEVVCQGNLCSKIVLYKESNRILRTCLATTLFLDCHYIRDGIFKIRSLVCICNTDHCNGGRRPPATDAAPTLVLFGLTLHSLTLGDVFT